MKYITDTLGIEVKTEPWDGTDGLPYYLIDRYVFSKVKLESVFCLFMKPKGEPDTLTNIKKHIANVRKVEQLPIVLELNNMPARRRKSLIQARIPFVAPECHIYLPFLGVALNERYTYMKSPGKTLMPSSQILLFYYLCQNELELFTSETSEKFNLSAMQVSRATKQLTALGLLSSRKDGVRTVIYGENRRRALFEKAKPYLLNPVRKRIYVEHPDLPKGLLLSGYSALSELTMLGGPSTETFAFFGKTGVLTGVDTLVDNISQAEVEIWRYDPALLSSHPGVVDALSLVASLSDGDDVRVKQSIDELLTTLWG